MKKIKVLLCLSAAFLLVGCKENRENQAQVLTITGSTSVEKVLVQLKEEYTALHPEVKIDYIGSGSSAGIADTKAGSNDIGVLSREVKQEEMETDLQTVIFAWDGIAVIVNPKNTAVSNLTTEQLALIYSGKIRNWQEVGGSDMEIFPISREESSGTRNAFEELTKLKEEGGLSNLAAVSEGNGTVQAQVASNPHAIGYVSFAYLDESIKPLSINGIEAVAKEAQEGRYPLARPFVFCYKTQDKDGDFIKEFLAFTLSLDSQELVEEEGGIAVR